MSGMPPATAATMVPFELVNDHVFIDVALNGTGPYHFVFDSGAPFALLDSGVARELGLSVRAVGTIGGVGDGRAAAGNATVGVVRIGALTLPHAPFVTTDLTATIGAVEGRRIDGVIGRDILKRFVTTFDYGQSRIVFGADVPALADGGASLIPLRIVGGIPQIACHIAMIPAVCNVDTGSRLAVTVPAPFAAAHPQVIAQTLSALGVDGYGLGGAALGRLGRLSALEFGGFIVRDAVCDYSAQTRGAFANPALGANIGGGILRLFAVTFDYAQHRIALRAADFGRLEPPDRSGLFLAGRADVVRVFDVRPDTPAAAAGIKKDDLVISVDGRAVTPGDLPAIRATLMAPTKTVVPLVLSRNGHAREVSLALQDYLPPVGQKARLRDL